jgi:hypothetical protein
MVACPTVTTDFPTGDTSTGAGRGGGGAFGGSTSGGIGWGTGGLSTLTGGAVAIGGIRGLGGFAPIGGFPGSGGGRTGGMAATSRGGTEGEESGGSDSTSGGSSGEDGSTGDGGTSAGGGGSTCEAGFLFCDDFEDGDATGWTTSGTWSVTTDAASSGTTYVYRGGGSGTQTATADPTSASADLTVEADMKATFTGSGSSYRAGILVRYVSSSSFFTLSIDEAGALTLRSGSSSVSSASGVCDTREPGVDPRAWNTYKIVVQGAPGAVRLTTYVNGVLQHDCTTRATGAPASGPAGLLAYGSGTVATFDNVKVSSP